MDPNVLKWVKAFFAARGWELAPLVTDAEALPDDLMDGVLLDDLRKALENANNTLQSLLQFPPDGLDEDGPLVSEALRLYEVTDQLLDDEDTDQARIELAALQSRLHQIATFRPPSDLVPEEPPKRSDELGYGWHPTDPPERQQFRIGVFKEVRSEGTDPVVTIDSLAGRPRGKHGGAQGQHVTAFVTLRETLVTACDERTEDEAWENVQHLFKGLLLFPAFGPEGLQDGMDLELVARIRGLAQGDTDVRAQFTLESAMAFYVEARDSMPGATLARGSHGDTSGKAEAKSVAALSKIEGGLKYDSRAEEVDNDSLMTRKKADETVDHLLKLIDPGAVARLAAGTAQRHAMETFVLGIAQAYPRIFACPCRVDDDEALDEGEDPEATDVGWLLIQKANKVLVPLPVPKDVGGEQVLAPESLASDEQAGDLWEKGRQCADLPVPRDPGPRPKVENFSVGLDQPPGGPLALDFTGRPADSLKDASKMGDHTCAMRLMSGGVSNALLRGDATMPNKSTLKARLEELMMAFDPKDYEEILEMGDIGEDYDDTGDSSEIVVHRRRVEMMRQVAANLKESCDKLAEGDDGPVDVMTLVKLGEEVMRLLDQRPTAVSYRKGKSDGNNEGRTAGRLDALEKALAENAPVDNAEMRNWEITSNLLALHDSSSGNFLYSGVVAEDQQAAMLDRLVDEFMWFAKSAYPRCVAAVDEARLAEAIRTEIKLTHHDEDKKDEDASEEEEDEDGEGGGGEEKGDKKHGLGSGAKSPKSKKQKK